MRVFHGSDTPISVIDLHKCKPGRDFGRGFYVTKLRLQADDMAKRVTRYSKKDPVVSEYEFDEYAFEDDELNVLRFDGYDNKWLDFVVLNRNADKRKQAHDYDIVEGPVADDKITKNITKYMQGKFSAQEFLEMLKYGNSNHQICFCSYKSLQMLEYIDRSENIEDYVSEIGELLVEQFMFDQQINETKAADLFFSSKTFGMLADVNTGFYLKPWQEIYEMIKKELNMTLGSETNI